MGNLERKLRSVGAVLVRNSKHKVFDYKGVRFLVSHGARTHGDRVERVQLRKLLRLAGKGDTRPSHVWGEGMVRRPTLKQRGL